MKWASFKGGAYKFTVGLFIYQFTVGLFIYQFTVGLFIYRSAAAWICRALILCLFPPPPAKKNNNKKQTTKTKNRSIKMKWAALSGVAWKFTVGLLTYQSAAAWVCHVLILCPFPPPPAKKNKTNKTKQNEKHINKNKTGVFQRRCVEVYCRPVYISVCSCLGLSRFNPMPPAPRHEKQNKTKRKTDK